MSFPVILDKSSPSTADTPLPGQISQIAGWLEDLFGIPNATNITGALLSLGALTDGKVATDTVVKGSSPFKRLIGTEASAKDVRVVEDAGILKVQHNTGTEAAPTWTDRFWIDLSNGQITKGSEFPGGGVTVLLFKQAAAPAGWTRVVDAGNTDAAIIIRQNSEVPGVGGTWSISGLTVASHTHGSPLTTSAPTGISSVGTTGGQALVANDTHTHTVTVAAASPAATGDGLWRPKYVDVIAASKD